MIFLDCPACIQKNRSKNVPVALLFSSNLPPLNLVWPLFICEGLFCYTLVTPPDVAVCFKKKSAFCEPLFMVSVPRDVSHCGGPGHASKGQPRWGGELSCFAVRGDVCTSAHSRFHTHSTLLLASALWYSLTAGPLNIVSFTIWIGLTVACVLRVKNKREKSLPNANGKSFLCGNAPRYATL